MKTRVMSVMVASVIALALGFAPAAEAKGKAKKVELSGVVNLNQGSAKQLDLLPGVGEKAVAKIIAYREKTPFKRIEELVKVKGFGKKKFEKMKPYLTVAGPSTLAAKQGPAPEKDRSQARSAPNPAR